MLKIGAIVSATVRIWTPRYKRHQTPRPAETSTTIVTVTINRQRLSSCLNQLLPGTTAVEALQREQAAQARVDAKVMANALMTKWWNRRYLREAQTIEAHPSELEVWLSWAGHRRRSRSEGS